MAKPIKLNTKARTCIHCDKPALPVLRYPRCAFHYAAICSYSIEDDSYTCPYCPFTTKVASVFIVHLDEHAQARKPIPALADVAALVDKLEKPSPLGEDR